MRRKYVIAFLYNNYELTYRHAARNHESTIDANSIWKFWTNVQNWSDRLLVANDSGYTDCATNVMKFSFNLICDKFA